MKKILLLILLLNSFIYAKKVDFSIVVHKPFDAALFDVTQNYDRTVTAVGFSKKYKQNNYTGQSYSNPFEYLQSVSNQYGSTIHILKVNAKAKIILSKNEIIDKFSEAVAVVKTPSNGYIIGGYTMDSSLLIIKLDQNANTIFTRQFGTKNFNRLNKLALLSDGGVLAIGSSATSRSTQDNVFENGLGSNDIFITKFSQNGRKLWSKKYGTEFDDEGIDAVEARDGSILVLSTTKYDNKKEVNFMRLTENGNKIWRMNYPKTENELIPHKIIRLKENNFVVAFSQLNDKGKERIRLVKLDLYQNILMDKEIYTTYPSVINDIKEFSNGTFIAVGYVKDIHNTDALAMLLDSNFALLNQEHFGDENYDVFNAVTILNNSQAAVVGIHTDNNSQESNMWIVKLNSDGSMAQIPTKQRTFYEILQEIYKKEIASNTISIKKDLSIEFNDKKLYFKASEYKLTDTQKKFLDKFSKKLIPFLYTNKDAIEAIEVNGHASSEWKGANFTDTYLNNEKLSINRSYSALSHIFETQNKSAQMILSKMLKGSGLSYSKKIAYGYVEDKEKSRRISFNIVLK